MATIHVAGTQLQPQLPRLPLIKPMLLALGATFIFAMHIFMPNPGGSGLALSFNATTWIGFSIALALGFYQLGTNGQLRYNKLTIFLFLSCLLLTVPMAYPNSGGYLAINRLIGLWAGFALFVSLQQFRFSNKQKQRLLWFIVIAVWIQSAYGLVQYFLLQPGNSLGYDTVANRPYGIFQQPNVMASFLATGLAISGYLLARQPIKYHRKLSSILFLYFTPIATIPLLIFLASRTGWLAASISTLLLLPYLYSFASKKRFIGWFGSVAVGVLIGLAPSWMFNQSMLAESRANLESARSYTFPQTLDMFVEKPFTGYGYGRFEPEYILYTARQHSLNDNYPAGLPAMDHPHNELLYWGVEGGIIPLLGIFLAAGIVLFRIYQIKPGTRMAMFALFVPIVIHSQLEYPFYHSAIHWLIFIILIYWVDQRSNSYRSVSFSIISKTLLRVLSLVIPIVTTFYMVSSLHTNYVLHQFERSSPPNPEILEEVSNPLVWEDRYNWDIYSTYLNIGLVQQDKALITPYIEWAKEIIQTKPRPAFYQHLIIAYQAIDDSVRAEQIRTEAQYLFPATDFSKIQYVKPGDVQPSAASASIENIASGAK